MAEWRKIPEAGTVFGIRLLVLIARVFGRRLAGWVLYGVALYFAIANTTARRASRDYLRRVGVPPTFTNVIRHIHTFAQVNLDRLFFLTGRWEPFRVEQRNHDMLEQLAKSRRGVLLLGAHLGSFEVMRCRAREYDLPINVVADFSNSERMTSVVRSLDPDSDTRLISLAGDPLSAMLAIREAIERGELVAILGDRPPSLDNDATGKAESRVVRAELLGADAAFPAGPWLLAHALRCPVYFVAGVYTRPNCYALHFELLADEVRLDRRGRAAALARYARTYAAMLETLARSAPLNWFNFYDFWAPASTAGTAQNAEPRGA